MTMAVQAPAKPVINNYDDDDDDDDTPIVFKRGGNSTSKQNQLNPEVKKLPSSSQILNGQSSNAQKDKKTVPSSKASLVKSPIGSPKASTLSAKASPMKSPVTTSRASSSLNDQSRQISKQNVSNAVKEDVTSINCETKPEVDDEDSDDDKPLSSRLKGISNDANKGVNAPTRVKDEDSDDDKAPLSSRFAVKSNAGTSGCKPNDSSEKKPLLSKIQLNGSTTKDKQQKSSMVPTKRPVDKVSSDQSSAKKPKLSDASTVTKVKQVTVKAEQKADDDDDIPISLRIKKAGSSDNKSSSSKQRVTKVVSSSFKKTNNKNKKQMKSSQYSKSTKVQPSSTDGQSKWTTLVHNGVIFPPPYKPHGIKITYKGRPVDLTPEQEEVHLNLFISIHSRKPFGYMSYSHSRCS